MRHETTIPDNPGEQENTYLAKETPNLAGLSVSDQLKVLLSTLKAADMDAAYAILGPASNIFNQVNEASPPLLRIVANYGKHAWGGEENNNAYSDYAVVKDAKKFGYTAIVFPDELPKGVLTPGEESMSEAEVQARLSTIEEKLTSPTLEGMEGDGPEDPLSTNYVRDISKYNELTLALDRLHFLENQKKLHAEFPALPKNKQLVKIAADAAATVDFETKYDFKDSYDPNTYFESSLELISDTSGHVSPMLAKNNSFGLDNDTATYLEIIHGNKWIKEKIEEMLSLDLAEIPLKSQAHLLKFMAEADDGRFDQLSRALGGINDKRLRQGLLKNFVAADFGAGFGDSLLEIAESRQLNDAEKQRIFDTISSCRESIGKITELYAGFDGGEFQGQFARATNERLTDAITVFSEIAKSGSAEADLGSKGRSKFDFAMAIEALEFERKSLEIIGGTLEDVSSGHKGAFAEVVLHPDASSDQLRLMRTMYNFYSPQHGYVLLYTRPEGSHSFDNDVEYGKSHGASNIGVEASISFIVDPTAKEPPFKLLSPFKPNPRSVMDFEKFGNPENKVSAIRLDREGRAPGRPANALERDPINEKGMVSVDLAAINDGEDTPSGKIARLISVGNKLRGDVLGKDSTLNHNTNWFDQAKYGTGAGFKKLVEYVDEVAAGWCRERSPDSEVEESFTYLYREAGRKATRAA